MSSDQPLAAGTDTSLACSRCGNTNTPDSLFCRHCGNSLRADQEPAATPAVDGATGGGLPTTATPVAASPVTVAPAAVEAVPLAPAATEEAPDEASGGPEAIDHRRAEQLVDRAFALDLSGDLAGAILACRQAIALEPELVAAWSKLGMLLEKNRDLAGAIVAFKKVVELAPESAVERDHLQQLQSRTSQPDVVFRFDDTELFSDTTGETPPPADAVPAVGGGIAAAGAAVPAGTGSSDTAAGAAAVAAAASPAGTPGAPAATTPAVQPPAGPVAAGTTTPLAATVGMPPPISPAPRVLTLDSDLVERPPFWSHALFTRPSFYFRSLPLALVTILGLGFLLWARNWSVARQAVPPVIVYDDNRTGAPYASGPQPGLPGAPAGAVAPPPLNASGNTATSPTITNSNQAAPAPAAPGGEALPAVPPRAAAPPRPAARPTPSPFDGLTPPRGDLNPPRAPEVVRIPPAGETAAGGDGGAQSREGQPMSPSGSPTRAPVRAVPYRVAPSSAPARPSNRAREAERVAATSARAGDTERATERVTYAIENNSNNQGWNYQYRGLLSLERGDYSRAIDDFRAAINSYREQIRRNDRTAEARKGIEACENGIRLAYANLQR